MIARIWKGTTKADSAEPYISHLQESVIPELSAIPGFCGVYVLRRVGTGAEEFLVLTLWESLEAVRRFSGPDTEHAVVPPKAQALLASYDTRATHFEVVCAREMGPWKES